MALSNYISLFLIAWLLLYAIGYYVFLSTSTSDLADTTSSKPDISFVQDTRSQPIAPLHSPFISTECPTEYGSPIASQRVGVVIYCRNCDQTKLSATIQSLLHGEERIASVVILDDHSQHPISASTFGSSRVLVISSSSHIGRMYSYINAVRHLSSTSLDAYLFAAPTAIAAPSYLTPLLHTLHANPNSIVYPSISYYDEKQEYSSREHLLKYAFDAGLNEIPMVPFLNNTSRVTYRQQADSLSVESISAVFSSAFFITTPTFLHDIGGFHSELSLYNTGNIELSIRAWLCGGGVIFSPCSHVKVAKDAGEYDVSHAGHLQHHDDADALLIARLYFPEEMRSSITNARYREHLPIVLQTSLDAVEPPSWAREGFSLTRCKSIDWFFANIYPDFLSHSSRVSPVDPESVVRNSEVMQKLLMQYSKANDDSHFTSEVAVSAGDKAEADKLAAMRVEHHVSRVRDELLCEDYNTGECAGAAKRGACKNDPGFMMFHCPKSCDFCGKDNLLCIDFYLNKCPVKAAEGECETNKEWMEENCRQSCKICSRSGDKAAPAVVVKVAPKPVEENTVRIDPYVAQHQWRDGSLPDPVTKNACELRGSDHSKILNRINLHQPLISAGDVPATASQEHVRIFCGSYTMENNHKTNVEVLRSSWGKRCDGYVAFSTVTDESIPAIAISHEGPESYNNMWQKSRSIWKYIAKFYMEDFDYFLLGGDDMYYIVENLQAYLSSDPAVLAATERNEGLYIGRRFYPGGGKVFNSGGAGYILNRAALMILRDHIDDKECFPHQQGFWEDVNVANCLKVKGGIEPFDTRDSQKRERFHPFTPALHYQYRIPKNPDWYAKYNPELGIGLECCSDESISFHYAKDAFMKQMHSYVYHCDTKA